MFALFAAGCTSEDTSGDGAVATEVTVPAPDDSPARTEVPSTEPAPAENDQSGADVSVATDPPATDPAIDPPASDPATDPPATDAATPDPPASDPSTSDPDPPPDLSFLWNDIDGFVAAWEGTNTTLEDTDPGTTAIVLTTDDLVIAPLDSGGDGFGATEITTAGYLSGTIDPSGEVSALVTTVDPDDPDATLLLATAMITLRNLWAAQDTEEFLSGVESAYLELSDDAAEVGEQRFVAGPFGSPYSAVTTRFEREGTGEVLVEVAVIPVPDEQVGLSVVELLRFELTAVTG